MVDFSVFFVIIEGINYFVLHYVKVHLDIALFITAGLALLFGLIGLCLKKPQETGNLTLKQVMYRVSRVFMVLAALIGGGIVWPMIVDVVVRTFGIDGQAFGAYSISTAVMLIGLGFLIASRFFTSEPNNRSLLNTRQFFGAVGMFAMIFLMFFSLYQISFAAFRKVLLSIFFVTECLSVLFWFYDPFIYILSQLFQGRRKVPCEPTPDKINRFAVIGCAHNEAGVIDQLIKSVHATMYPKNSYDVYVICDNCTDDTADVVRKSGAIAMERNDPEHRGKGFGLKWMFEKLDQERRRGNEYDAYIILDADNLVNEAFLDAINDKMNEGYEILQAYLGCKNPGDTWISMSYSYSYWVSNAIYQNAHSRVGLSAQMGGTGMVLRPKVLDEIGWDTDSLTEDLVLTARYMLAKNLPACWVHDAKLYDEKPLRLTPSIRQRTRWMQGHMAAMFKFAPKLLWSGIKNFSLRQLDVAFYLMRPFLNLLMFLSYLVHIYFNMFQPEGFTSTSFVMGANTSILLLIGYFILQFYVLFNEYHARYIPTFILQFFFSFTWYPAIFRGLIKRKERYWVSTIHTRNLSIGEVREDAQLQEAKERLKGLDNLHRLPLGQILLKATVITKKQLDEALQQQNAHGGFLGDIIVDMNVISQDTLSAYLSVQQTMKEEAAREGRGDDHLRLGDILVNSGLITAAQLEAALEHQKNYGGYLGACLIATHCLPVELLKIFLEVQKLLDANFVSPTSARQLINGVLASSTENIGTILWKGGLVSRQQLDLALEYQRQTGMQIGAILVESGFINERTLEVILELQNKGRAFMEGREGPPGGKDGA